MKTKSTNVEGSSRLKFIFCVMETTSVFRQIKYGTVKGNGHTCKFYISHHFYEAFHMAGVGNFEVMLNC
jgi:hypothetical protein